MKKIFYILAGAVAILTSCQKTLDKKPLDKLTEETFFETDAGMLSFSNTFYTSLPGGTSLYLDNADNYFQLAQLLEARGKRTVPASGSGWTWTDLRDFNTLIGNAGQYKGSESKKNQYIALARFFRAYFYFEKVKRFGDVPWIDAQLGSADQQLYAKRDSREVVIQNVIKDLDFAIQNLPTTHSAYEITSWTALALKSRVCLFEGTYRKYHKIEGYDHDWKWYLDQCIEASDKFVEKSGYSIYSDNTKDKNYLDLFTTNTIQGSPVAKEVILARNYNLSYSVLHNSTYTFTVSSMGKYGMSRKTMASYLMADGKPFTNQTGWETFSYSQEMVGRDPRLAQTIRTPGYTRLDDPLQLAPNLSQTVTGYQPIKYVGPTTMNANDKSDLDLIIMRAGEVYLNYAEAAAERGILTSDILAKTINKLRQRVGMPDLTLGVTEDPFLTNLEWGGYQSVATDEPQRALILEIRRERCVELNQEGFRYYDLMRWREGKIFENSKQYGMYLETDSATGNRSYDFDGNGTVDLVIWTAGKKPTTIPTTAVALEIGKDITLSEGDHGMIDIYSDPGMWNDTKDKDYLYPIPTDELNLNPNLEQNPGW